SSRMACSIGPRIIPSLGVPSALALMAKRSDRIHEGPPSTDAPGVGSGLFRPFPKKMYAKLMKPKTVSQSVILPGENTGVPERMFEGQGLIEITSHFGMTGAGPVPGREPCGENAFAIRISAAIVNIISKALLIALCLRIVGPPAVCTRNY